MIYSDPQTQLSGRRKELRVLPYHRDCQEAVDKRNAKWAADKVLYGDEKAVFAQGDSDNEA